MLSVELCVSTLLEVELNTLQVKKESKMTQGADNYSESGTFLIVI